MLVARGRESHDGHLWPARKEVNACRFVGTRRLYPSMDQGFNKPLFGVDILLFDTSETLSDLLIGLPEEQFLQENGPCGE